MKKLLEEIGVDLKWVILIFFTAAVSISIITKKDIPQLNDEVKYLKQCASDNKSKIYEHETRLAVHDSILVEIRDSLKEIKQSVRRTDER